MSQLALESFRTVDEDKSQIKRSERLPFDQPFTTDPNYPKRVEVPEDRRKWETYLPEYAPTFFESPRLAQQDRTKVVGGWADPAQVSYEQFLEWSRNGYLRSYEGPIQHDPLSGRPLNPLGRTGISGRGLLGRWGANQAADAIVTRISENTGRLEMLFVLRPSGHWAVPGGFLDTGEAPLDAALRELREESGVIPGNTAIPWLVYQGIGDGPRTTDNAWVETSVYHFHVSALDDSSQLIPGSSEETLDAVWCELTPNFVDALYANHPDLVRMAISQFMLRCDNPSAELRQQLASFTRSTVITSFKDLRGRVALFGGTFDPPHSAHLEIGPHVLRERDLDAVIYVPTTQNPLKSARPTSSARERLEMLQYGVREKPGMFVSPIESRLPSPCYTIHTIDAINSQIDRSKCSLYFIMGSDSLRTLPLWDECERLVQEVEIITVLRGGEPNPLADQQVVQSLTKAFGEDFVAKIAANMVSNLERMISASDVRSLLAEKFTVGDLLTPEVRDYIVRKGLY